MFAAIAGIEYHLPARMLTNQQLAEEFPDWSAAKIAEKTGIETRRLAEPNECASDLAFAAACKLFDSGVCSPKIIDFVLFCTQSPDYIMPTTACLLQNRLGIPTRAGALDFNLGCSGFVYGLSLAKGLIESGQAANVLLLTADTLTKYLHPLDRGTRTLLGDAGAATLVTASKEECGLGPIVFGTDGGGSDQLIVRNGGARHPGRALGTGACPREAAPLPSPDHFYMNGPEIFSFALRVVPDAIEQLLSRANLTLDAVDRFVFHQANSFILEHLRNKLNIPRQKFVLAMRHCGNTSSSSIPIALKEARAEIRPGMTVALVGFGVGLSWAAALEKVSGTNATAFGCPASAL